MKFCAVSEETEQWERESSGIGIGIGERRRLMATMERLLMALENQVVGGESVLGSIKIAVLPIVKVFTMCFLGLLMASKYVNILPASGRRLLNGVCIYVYVYVCVYCSCSYVMWSWMKVHFSMCF